MATYRPQPLPINLGPSSFKAKVVTRIRPEGFRLNQVTALGTATMNLGQGQVNATRWQLDRGELSAEVNLNNLNLRALYPTIPEQLASGNLAGQGTVQTRIDNGQGNLQTKGRFTVDTAFGRTNVQRFTLQQDQWQALASTSIANLGRLAPSLAPLGRANGTFTLDGNLTTKQITGSGLAEMAGGTITAENIAIDPQTWAAEIKTRNVNLAPIANLTSPAIANSSFAIAGLMGDVTPETLTLKGKGQIRLGQGQIAIDRFNLQDGRWQGGATAQNLDPKTFKLPFAQNLGGSSPGVRPDQKL
ncbi:MAG: hypothetical protein HC796_04610 [Synechococcaceae cyanobacterium RL_1_2]|nr:hypothetical protein [Synechococcaceae cyanobacterium RL_1_2]